MRKVVLVGLLVLAGCSKPAEYEAAKKITTADGKAPVADVATAPRLGLEAAPDLALRYTYGYRFAASAIAAAQETHARQCEAMGPSQCRITALVYDVGRDNSVTASLSVEVLPAQARGFGQRATDATRKAGGMLTSVRIESENAGGDARESAQKASELAQERRDTIAQLARGDLPAA